MPHLDKKAFSQYIRTDCQRQLRLNLTPLTAEFAAARRAEDMPPKQPPRPGLEAFTQAGNEWQREKLSDLIDTFGAAAIVGEFERGNDGRWQFGRERDLTRALNEALENQFILEASYSIGPTFEAAYGIETYRERYALSYGVLRPDILQVLPRRSCRRVVLPDGELAVIADDDDRLQLRVIDIKLTAEPSPSYLGEIAYYATALAGWLRDQELDNRFSVSADCAVWPGSHEASELTRTFHGLRQRGQIPAVAALLEALLKDLEVVPFEVFSIRLRRFLKFEMPLVMGHRWQDLPWHVDGRCRGCDYLGYPWRRRDGTTNNDPRQCMPMAEVEDHVSRIAFVTRGAGLALRQADVSQVAAVAELVPDSPVFAGHQALRATRSVVAGRARALRDNTSSIPPEAGTSAVMPRWADLRIFLTVDFDISSAITFAFGIKAFWRNPDASADGTHEHHSWPPRVFVVNERGTQAERRELLQFLQYLNDILQYAHGRNARSKFQLYLWDSLQFDHLSRVIGRHLEAILTAGAISNLAWLFPPEELLENARMASADSPITVIRDAVKALVAAPPPHYYSLLSVARSYHPAGLPDGVAQFSIHPLFEDSLSDQIPSERAHEIWSHSADPYWLDQLAILQETVGKRLRALEAVSQRLEVDLRDVLPAGAPQIRVAPPPREARVSTDGQLWYAFAKLDVAVAALEVRRIRALPPHEREAKFNSARLEEKLAGQAAIDALQSFGLAVQNGRHVYRLRPESLDAKFREGDFDLALVSEDEPLLLSRKLASVVFGTPIQDAFADWQAHSGMDVMMQVTIKAVDRERRLVVVDLKHHGVADTLVNAGLLRLDRNMILDPIDQDFFLKKLLEALRSIGNPLIARDSSVVRRALGQPTGNARRAATTPTAEALWGAAALAAGETGRRLDGIRATLEARGVTLNEPQWLAWHSSLSTRMRLLWGPPGTGKTRTLRAIALGALLEASEQRRPVRILVCASTYTAMDNVLLGVHGSILRVLPGAGLQVARLRSSFHALEPHVPAAVDVVVNRGRPTESLTALRAMLVQGNQSVVVGSTPEQVFNLATVGNQEPVQALFDLIVIDEATQMDVAKAILPLCTMAPRASVVLAGDRLQLPPIHQAEPPLDLEDMVGSSYAYFRSIHGVPELELEINYRSAREIVDFSRLAGYPPQLQAFSPDIRLDLAEAPAGVPEGWPASLVWSDVINNILDADTRCVCVVYDDGHSSQSNRFEADLIAGLLWTLRQRARSRLSNDLDAVTGEAIALLDELHDAESFWSTAVGVVTPHRAQQALITSRVRSVFAADAVEALLIRDAIDTVERFQGQERDTIIASFALGDPDQIAQEDEFLQSLNRFNVVSSRPRAKLIVLVSQQVVDHLSSDMDVLKDSRLLKMYAESYCNHTTTAELTYLNGDRRQVVSCSVKVRRPLA